MRGHFGALVNPNYFYLQNQRWSAELKDYLIKNSVLAKISGNLHQKWDKLTRQPANMPDNLWEEFRATSPKTYKWLEQNPEIFSPIHEPAVVQVSPIQEPSPVERSRIMFSEGPGNEVLRVPHYAGTELAMEVPHQYNDISNAISAQQRANYGGANLPAQPRDFSRARDMGYYLSALGVVGVAGLAHYLTQGKVDDAKKLIDETMGKSPERSTLLNDMQQNIRTYEEPRKIMSEPPEDDMTKFGYWEGRYINRKLIPRSYTGLDNIDSHVAPRGTNISTVADGPFPRTANLQVPSGGQYLPQSRNVASYEIPAEPLGRHHYHAIRKQYLENYPLRYKHAFVDRPEREAPVGEKPITFGTESPRGFGYLGEGAKFESFVHSGNLAKNPYPDNKVIYGQKFRTHLQKELTAGPLGRNPQFQF